MKKKKYFCARFYITYRCNSRCVYCNVWKNPGFSQEELPLEKAEKLVGQLYEAGVRYIDFTGGEPSLYPGLEELLLHAKKLGIKTEVTSNCIRTGTKGVRQLERIAECADKFNVSLDTLDPDSYRRIRGVDGCETVRQFIENSLRSDPSTIMTVVTDQNIGQLDDMVCFAQTNKASIYLSPMFCYFEEDGTYTEAAYLRQILSKTYEPYAVVLLHFMLFFEEASQTRCPPCSANQMTLTISPNGGIMLPCYHQYQESIPWQGDLESILTSERFCYYQENSGLLEPCRGCTVIPYMGISFAYRLDRFFLLQSYSEDLKHLKQNYLNAAFDRLQTDQSELLRLMNRLLQMVRSMKASDTEDDKKSRWNVFYHAVDCGGRCQTDIYRGDMTAEEYQEDQQKEDCWQLVCTPHYFYDKIFSAVYPLIHGLLEDGIIGEADYIRIFSKAEEFQLHLWNCYLGMFIKVETVCGLSEEQKWLERHLDELLELTGLSGRRKQAVHAVTMVKLMLHAGHAKQDEWTREEGAGEELGEKEKQVLRRHRRLTEKQ